jgi:transitional endoplasmic reticulum ATPase
VGRAQFVKALAKETNLPFINLRTENLFSMWLGESRRKFSEAIRLAEQMSPAIVFIDEIDRCGKRSGTSADGASQETQRVFSQVLEWLGDKRRRSIIVGTTNTPEPGGSEQVSPQLEDRSIALPIAGIVAVKVGPHPGDLLRCQRPRLHRWVCLPTLETIDVMH